MNKILIILIRNLFILTSFATDDDLDTSLGSNGFTTISGVSFYNIFIQDDGKIIAVM